MKLIKLIAKIIGIALFAILWIRFCFLDPKAGFLLLCAAGIWSIAHTLDERLPMGEIKVHVVHKMEVKEDQTPHKEG